MHPTQGLDHIGIAVTSIETARVFYETALGACYVGTETVLSEGVRVGIFLIGEGEASVRIELLEPLDDTSPVAKFMAKRGPGVHHLAFRQQALPAHLNALKAQGVRLVNETAKAGAEDKSIAFVHPQSTQGVLVELCEPSHVVSPTHEQTD